MKPFIKMNHRFGSVFMRIVGMSKFGHMSMMARLSPEEAREIAKALSELAARAAGKHK